MKRNYDTDKNGKNRSQGCWYLQSHNGDRIYYCRIKLDGKPTDVKFGRASEGKNFVQCRAYRTNLMAGTVKTPQQKRRDNEASARNNLNQVFDRFAVKEGKGGVPHNRQKSWNSTTGRYNNYLVPFFKESKDLSTVTTKDFNRFKNQLLKTLSPQTTKHILRLLKQLCSMAGNSLVDEDGDAAKMPTVRNQVTEDLTKDQLASLKAVLAARKNPILCDLLSFIMATGCRQGECLRLTRSDIDFKKGTIRLNERKSSGQDMDITIPMSAAARAICKHRIQENLQLPGANNYIFPGRNGSKRFDSKRARAIMTEAGIGMDFRPCHGLRHWYATELVHRGVAIHIVAKMLGHNDIATTQRYFVGRDEDMQAAAELMSEVVG